MLRFVTLILLPVLLLCSCRPDNYIPKPRGYYKIDFPEHTYTQFRNEGYPYSFEYPAYGRIVRDTSFFNEKPDNPYWVNMIFDTLGAQLYLTYKPITAAQPLQKLVEDAYKMSYFHDKKADYIADHSFNTVNHVSGIFYNVGGNAATNHQFFATDSLHHFIWGSLYFNVTPNADSLLPVNDFLQKDIAHLIETMKWRE